MIGSSQAAPGWGPMLYDVAMEYATMKGGGIMADRGSVSPTARNVWDYYMNNRGDVSGIQMDDRKNTLTPEEEDNCSQKVAGLDNRSQQDKSKLSPTGTYKTDWVDSPLSKRWTKPPTTIEALRAAGKLVWHEAGDHLPLRDLDAEGPIMHLEAVLFGNVYEFPIKPPPIEGSPESLADLMEVIHQYSNRVVPECLQRRFDEDMVGMFVEYMQNRGISINESYYKKLGNDLLPIISKLKMKYNRLRPSWLARKLEIDFKGDFLKSGQSASYPSGHTMQAYVIALLLSSQHPEYTIELMAMAEGISQSRVDRGIHFQSDIDFGREAAYIIVNEILNKQGQQILFT